VTRPPPTPGGTATPESHEHPRWRCSACVPTPAPQEGRCKPPTPVEAVRGFLAVRPVQHRRHRPSSPAVTLVAIGMPQHSGRMELWGLWSDIEKPVARPLSMSNRACLRSDKKGELRCTTKPKPQLWPRQHTFASLCHVMPIFFMVYLVLCAQGLYGKGRSAQISCTASLTHDKHDR
jgi:hypothetical protein